MFDYLIKNFILKKQTVFWLFFLILTFLIGYFLRSYYSIFKYLPYSPYDLFFETNLFGKNLGLDLFSAKVLNYPLGYYLSLISRINFKYVYLTYIFGSLIFFLFGQELSGQKIGGILVTIGFAVGYENLIQYTGITYPSGLSYVLIITSLYFLYKYFINRRLFWLCLFWLSGTAVLFTYHTGAGAFFLILIGILISLLISPKPLDKRLLLSFLSLWAIYLMVLILMDPQQLLLINDSFSTLGLRTFFVSLALLGAGVIIVIAFTKFNLNQTNQHFLLLASISVALILISLPFNVFQPLLKLGTLNYFSSALTLNNYLAQAVLFHIYLVFFLKDLIFASLDDKKIFLRGWLIGLFLIFTTFSIAKYHVRILDYSFPLMFLFFGWYWSDKTKYRILTVATVVILLVFSQFRIFSDPFSARRYYDIAEAQTAQKIIDLNLDGVMLSDLRTSALFEYLGKDDVLFFNSESQEHNWLFYKPEKIQNYKYPSQLQRNKNSIYVYKTPNYYLILSQKMKQLVYSTNFQTKPLDQWLFAFFDKNYQKVYSDDQMMVYLIHPETPIKNLDSKNSL